MASTIMEQIIECLDNKNNFLLSGGAGSGKTYTLVQTLNYVFNKNNNSSVACITYTNVAANEIKDRSPFTNLFVSTIHDFLWEEIKDYQKNLKESLNNLLQNGEISYSGEIEINDLIFDKIEYKNYRKIENGVISHDDLLKIANYMFSKYPLLSKILCDKFDYIFIDEYQDTQKLVIEIFLSHITNMAKDKLGIGFFGDKMQCIYETGVGNIQEYISNGQVKEIIKEDNFRCSVSVIELLNKIRSDITQNPAKVLDNGSIINKVGSAKFLYSYSASEFNLGDIKESEFILNWDFDNSDNTKVLFLTHKLNAKLLGFAELLSSYKHIDNLIVNDPDRLALHLQRIGGIIHHYEQSNYAYVIEQIHKKIKTLSNKKEISVCLKQVLDNKNMTIEELINYFNVNKIVLIDDNLKMYIENNNDIFNKVKELSRLQVQSYFLYYNKFSPFSTQHGVKGAEFDNVLVVMDNGKWNNYNFKYYFENTSTKEKIIQRTEKIFYVTCSRAKDNLIVYYPSPSEAIISQAQILFGDNNVHEICNRN